MPAPQNSLVRTGDHGAASPVTAMLRESTARRLRALGHPTRLRLIELLSRGGKPVGELARLAEMEPDAVSKHLRALAEVRILQRPQQGNFAVYTIGDGDAARLVALAYRGVLREIKRLQDAAELTEERSRR